MRSVNLYYPIERVTGKAIALRVDENFLVWLPKSLIRAYKRQIGEHTEYKTVVPYWLAEEKGLLVKNFHGDYVYISDADIMVED